jgi:hypothetical protein
MTLTTSGIAAGWAIEHLPTNRVMGDGILLPDGRVLIINGATTGVAGYGAVSRRVGQSDADNVGSQSLFVLIEFLTICCTAEFPARHI